MPNIDSEQLLRDYNRDGVVRIHQFFSAAEVDRIRGEIDRYILEDLESKPADAATREADGVTVRNLWRLEQHNPFLCELAERVSVQNLVAPLVGGRPILQGVETFNKPAKVGSAVPDHQDNAYFCQTPPDMLTVWIAIDAVTETNGPIYFVKGSHLGGVLPTKPSHVRGNSIGLAEPCGVPLEEQFCGLLNPGDATIHHCNTIHHSGPNTTDRSRLGLLFVYRGAHTTIDPKLKVMYNEACRLTPPA